MQVLSKEQLKDCLKKPILQCTEEEIRFAFHVLGFDLKEFKQEQGRVSFEIHYRQFYIIKLEVVGGLSIFSSIWIIFNDKEESHSLSIQEPSCFVALLGTFFNLFNSSLLEPVRYRPGFMKGWSIFETPEEAKGYWETIGNVLHEVCPSPAPSPEEKKPAAKNFKKKKILS